MILTKEETELINSARAELKQRKEGNYALGRYLMTIELLLKILDQR